VSFKRISLYLVVSVLLISHQWTFAAEWSGNITAEARYFFEDALDNRQHRSTFSLSAQPEFYHEWDNRYQSLTFVPFIRWDEHDDERSHFDIRELTWLKAARDWELRIGIRKVFWGVTESQHLVDIINQTDLVESPDGEEKLGQPMVNFAWIQNWGTLDLFVLPGFRERSFAGSEGRPRTNPLVDADRAVYASPREDRHIDFALRWSHSIGNWDIGIAHFNGTSRDPDLLPGLNLQNQPVLIPLYQTIDQTSLDLQLVTEDWLWKLEALTRQGQNGGRYFAFSGGFEYTLVGIYDSDADLGLIAEYHFDDRKDFAPTPFNQDLMLGARLAMNDVQSTEALAGFILDTNDNSKVFSIEASRRIGDSWKIMLEGRMITDTPSQSPLYSLRKDDYVQLELGYYF